MSLTACFYRSNRWNGTVKTTRHYLVAECAMCRLIHKYVSWFKNQSNPCLKHFFVVCWSPGPEGYEAANFCVLSVE